MDRVELQIKVNNEYKKVDINRGTSFAFNLQSSELTNPTSIKVPFSVNIRLPRTKNNSDLFNHIWKIDHQILDFNPIARTDFRLYVNNNLYQTGYIKLTNASDEFHIVLYGGLGDYFYTLSNIKLADLDFGDDLSHMVNSETIYNIMNDITVKSKNGKRLNDYLNYALTYQGVYDNFDNKMEDYFNKDNLDFGEQREVLWMMDNKVYQAPDNMTEHYRVFKDINNRMLYGEYRAEYQKPAIKVDYIINKIINTMKAEGWKTNLDNTFFNQKNPYWNDLWLITDNYELDDEVSSIDLDIPIIDPNDHHILSRPHKFTGVDFAYKRTHHCVYSTKVDSMIVRQIVDMSDINLPTTGNIDIDVEIPYNMLVYVDQLDASQASSGAHYRKRPGDSLLTLQCSIVYRKGDRVLKRFNLKDNISNSTSKIWATDGVEPALSYLYMSDFKNKRTAYLSDKDDNKDYSFSGQFVLPASMVDKDAKFELELVLKGDTRWQRREGSNVINTGFRPDITKDYKVNITRAQSEDGSAGLSVTSKDIFKTDYNCYDFLTSYTKVFGLIFVKNPIEKTINILTRNSYFKDLKVVDWSEKIDRSQAIEIQPVMFNYRYGMFKWNESNTKYEEQYKSKYDVEYGSLKFDNGSTFTNEENNYLDKIIFDNGIVVDGMSQYFYKRNSTMYKDNKSLLHLEDKNGSKSDTNFILAFKDGVDTLSKKFLITDKTLNQMYEGSMWTNKGRICDKYIKFNRIIERGGDIYSLNFGRPKISYTDKDALLTNNTSTNGNETIYRRFWSGYLNDRFSRENKTLIAQFNINNNDLADDIFNKFINIDNTLWVINKVNKFDPLNTGTTKVELIKVQDKNNYISQRYVDLDFKVYLEGKLILIFEDGNDNKNQNPYFYKTDLNKHTINLSIVTSEDYLYSVQSGDLSVIKTSYGLIIDVPATVNHKESSVVIFYGDKAYYFIINQVGSWKVEASTNYGLVSINGKDSPQDIKDGELANFSTSYDGIFLYWDINNVIYSEQYPKIKVNEPIVAKAVWKEKGSAINLS